MTEPSKLDALKEAHGKVHEAFEAMLVAGHDAVGTKALSTDTAMALGLAAGHVAKASALLGRDIDDLSRAERVE